MVGKLKIGLVSVIAGLAVGCSDSYVADKSIDVGLDSSILFGDINVNYDSKTPKDIQPDSPDVNYKPDIPKDINTEPDISIDSIIGDADMFEPDACIEVKFYQDSDGDTYGNPKEIKYACEQPDGYVNNSDDCDDSNKEINPKSSELCNGVDDNCNLYADETFNVDEECYDGKGECNTLGKYVCSSDNLSTVCSSIQLNPSTEVCDNLDNDCDGETDEDFNLDEDCDKGLGECNNTGKFICYEDKLKSICGAIPKKPTTEVCDYKDNNCDGQTDESFNVGSNCVEGKGECEVKGKYVCSDSELKSVCDTLPKIPTIEVCDYKDNDCDGETDEKFNLGKDCIVGIGECENKGKYVCSDTTLISICDVLPKNPTPEVCDNKDNNCDGDKDEKLTKECFTKGGKGLEYCIDGKWKLCDAPKPTKEFCDGKDNDFDGKIDEDFKLGEKCDIGVGECNSTGVYVCEPLGFTSVCNAIPKKPLKEICDNKDNNCDGDKDEKLTKECFTKGGKGLEYCIDGKWKLCDAPKPTLEVCDGKDNNFDGKIDEGFKVGEKCYTGVGKCISSGVYVCDPGALKSICDAVPKKPVKEICDGFDNNCNGQVDEGVLLTFFKDNDKDNFGDAKNSIKGCKPGEGYSNNDKDCNDKDKAINPKAAELCDKIDNNCDGKVDEKFLSLENACVSGKGACETKGKYVCSDDKLVEICNAIPKKPSKEVCNSVDDNCNGEVDENLSQKCFTKGGKGLEYCINGVWKFCDAPKPKTEVCDGKDNDLDGKVDEGFKLGEKCSTGDGKCDGIGVYVCDPIKLTSICNAVSKNECEPGEKGCGINNNYTTCGQVGDCWGWQPTSCPGNSKCVEGNCVPK